MEDTIRNTTSDNLVNYSNISTSNSNGVYVAPTETEDSIAFLIKNNILIEYSLTPEPIEKDKTIPPTSTK